MWVFVMNPQVHGIAGQDWWVIEANAWKEILSSNALDFVLNSSDFDSSAPATPRTSNVGLPLLKRKTPAPGAPAKSPAMPGPIRPTAPQPSPSKKQKAKDDSGELLPNVAVLSDAEVFASSIQTWFLSVVSAIEIFVTDTATTQLSWIARRMDELKLAS
jgi:hypothetical protein